MAGVLAACGLSTIGCGMAGVLGVPGVVRVPGLLGVVHVAGLGAVGVLCVRHVARLGPAGVLLVTGLGVCLLGVLSLGVLEILGVVGLGVLGLLGIGLGIGGERLSADQHQQFGGDLVFEQGDEGIRVAHPQ